MPNGWAKFSPEYITVTPACLQAFQRTGERMIPFLVRHLRGDYGDAMPERVQENEFAVRNGLRIISEYTLMDGTRFWIHTEADRSRTEFMLPEEYGGGTVP